MGIKGKPVDLFGQAENAAPEKKNSKGKVVKNHEWDEHFEVFCALNIFFKALEGTKNQMGDAYKEEAFEVFKADMLSNKVKLKSFDVVAGAASASYQYRTTSGSIAPEITEILDKYDIPYEKQEKVPERFAVNPELLEDPAMRDKINAALSKVDTGGKQLFIKQNPVFACKMIDATVPAIVNKVKNEEEKDLLLREIATLAIYKPSLDGCSWKEKAAEGSDDEKNNAMLMQKSLSMLQACGIVALQKGRKSKK